MIVRVLLLTTFVILYASISCAEFTLSTGIGMRLEYNDNIFLEHDAEDDFIAKLTPNFSIGWELPYLTLSLNAGLMIEKYMDHTEEDDISPDLGQPTEFDLLLNLYKELLFLKITDTFSQVMIDEDGRGGEGNSTVNLTSSNLLRINPYLQFALAKATQLRLGYTYENLWYKDDEGDDSESHIYSALLTQMISPKVTILLNGAYSQFRPKNPDKGLVFGGSGTYEYDRKNASIGFSYEATERLMLKGQYGRTWLDYDVREDSDSNVWSASFDYEITSAYTVGASYVKNYTVSVEGGPSDSDRVLAYLQYSDRFKLKGSLFSNTSSYVEINREEDSYGYELTGELPLNDKVGVTGLLRYTNFDESGLFAQEQDRYSASFSLYYETRLGRASIGYIYNRNDSELNSADYTNNIIFVSASLQY